MSTAIDSDELIEALCCEAEQLREGYNLLPKRRRELLHYCFDLLLDQERYVTAAKKYLDLGSKFEYRLPHRCSQVVAAAFLIGEIVEEILALDDEVRPQIEAQKKQKACQEKREDLQ